jgi:hypothetical protein
MIGVSRIKTYLGNEQLRFLLVNSQQTSQQCPAVFDNKPVVRAQALAAAKRMLREDFDLVATIEDLEVQKSAFLEFFGYPIEEVEEQRQQQPTAKQTPAAVEAVAAAAATTTTAATATVHETTTAAAVAAAATSASSGTAYISRRPNRLGHVHRIDYTKEGVTDEEMTRMRAHFGGAKNDLDNQLYALAKQLSSENAAMRRHRQRQRL